MPGGEEQARDYVTEMRRRGFAESEIAAALQAAGWSEEQTRRIMSEETAVAPEEKPAEAAVSKGLPPPPPGPPAAAAPRKGLSTGAIVAIVVGVGCLVLLLPTIAILAAILFPVFGEAREKAREATCMSNVKQVMMGQQMYAYDWDEILPPAADWPQVCYPYVRNAEVYLCPSDARPDKQRSEDLETSYTMSATVGNLRLPDVAKPMSLGVLFEGTEVAGGREVAEFRHRGGLNVGYADGHVRWLSEGDFADLPLSPSEVAGGGPGRPVTPQVGWG